MNWYSVFSVRSVMGVALVMAGLAHAAEVKLSETAALQAAGDLTYTFAAGDTFVVDAAFSPTSFKPICSGDFTLKVEGSGSIAATTQLDFSAVSGALTLSGLGTTESSLPKQTSTAPEPAAVEPAPVQVTEDNATLTFAPVLLTAEAETVPTLTISEASATWSTGSWSSDSAPTSGEAVISATTDATLTIDAAVSLSSLTFEVTDGKTLTIALGTGGSLAVTTATKVTSGKVIAPKGTYKALTVNDGAAFLAADSGVSATSVAAGGTVGVVGAGTWGATSSTTSAGAGVETMASRFVLRTGTFRKKGEGSFHVGFYKLSSATDQNIEVAGGTLEYYVRGGTRGIDDHTFKTLTVDEGCTFLAQTYWAMKITVANALRGEGAVTLSQASSQDSSRNLQLDGVADAYTGAMTLTGTTLTFGETFGGTFGGTLSLAAGSNSRVGKLVVARAEGVTIAKDVTLGSGVGLDLSAGGGLSIGGTLTLGGDNVFTLSESAKAGDVLIALTGEGAQADVETAEKISVSTPGLFVSAKGANYVLAASPELSLAADGVWSTAGWTSGGSSLTEAPTSGGAKVIVTANVTLTIDAAVSLTDLTFEVAEGKTLTIVLAEGGSLATEATMVSSGKVIVQGGTYGAVTIADAATLLFAQDGMFTSIAEGGTVGLTTEGSLTLDKSGSGTATNSSKLLLRKGTFRKEGAGSVELRTYNVADAANQSIEVVGGTLKFYGHGGSDNHTFKSVYVGATTTFEASFNWGTYIAVSETLRGEGTIKSSGTRGTNQFKLQGDASAFTGTLQCTSGKLEMSSEIFGGKISLNSGTTLSIKRAEGVTVSGDVTLGSGVGLDLSAGGGLSVGGSFTAEGTVPVTLPATPADGFALVTLTGEGALASDETAEKFASVPSGYVVVAERAAYVLRKVMTLPGVNPSEPGAGDGQAYSPKAAVALTAAAEAVQLAEVSQVLLQTKGAAAAVPTVTEVNNVLGCFDGVVEADAEAQTLTIRYEFGVADIAADDSETPWNGNWQVVAKVEGPTGAAFAEGITVAAYEVGEDGEIPENATPLSSATVGAGTNAVTLKGLVFEGLGTHGVRVRVKATK
ncbi:MAG: hypothetical protein ACI4YA_06700 [Candidatus Spyradenecus sp.]